MGSFVMPLGGGSVDLASAGGKGESLARLVEAGMPVPPGFLVTTGAYREFVERNALQDRVLAALDDSADRAAPRIGELFAGGELPAEVAEPIRQAYERMGGGRVAVRSSATAEDLPSASFAGQQDTYLDIEGTRNVLDAVRRCWASLWTARAIEYRSRQGISPSDVALAVVVQRMVPAEAAGVLFTADPVTGDRERLMLNAIRGLGESLVSGEADAQVIVVAPDDAIVERTGPAVLDDATALRLTALGRRIETLYARPMDIEWAVAGGEEFVLQARPITVSGDSSVVSGDSSAVAGVAYDPWNDSRQGDLVWTCGNLGEAIPSVMTPATWSLVRIFMSEAMSVPAIGAYTLIGRIGGRFYLNLTLSDSLTWAIGLSKLASQGAEQAFGNRPASLGAPRVPLSRWEIIRASLPSIRRFLGHVRAYKKSFEQLVEANPRRCKGLRDRISGIDDPGELAALWTSEVEPLLRDTSRLLAAGARADGAGLVRIRPWLTKLVGEEDAATLFTGLSADDGPLASLGPVVGLGELARGEISRETYAERWGHRCPDEFEVSVPRPAEDPAWIDRELAGLADAPDAGTLLARQEKRRAEAHERFARRYPRKVRTLDRRLAGAGRAVRGRERARSEVIRAFWVLRAYVVRAGELTGRGADLFQLEIDEIVALLRNPDSTTATTALGQVEERRRAYDGYVALGPCPTWIRGEFEPFAWAKVPNRRLDVYDARTAGKPETPTEQGETTITGFRGARGVVEGVVRVLRSVDEAGALEPGEILVTTVTNVGWTPVFPRAGAVVTDIGAPLSHAAIVARELGIPAVVGTGTATSRLHTGDRVRVDGSTGTVEVLERR